MKLLKILSIFVFIAFLTFACGSGGSNSGNNNSTSPEGYVKVSGIIDVASGINASEKQLAEVFVIGQEGLKVLTDADGNFTLFVDTSQGGIVTSSANNISIQSTSSNKYSLIIYSSTGQAGKKIEIDISVNVDIDLSTIFIKRTGSITGNIKLENQTDYTGIRLYIPGTSFAAMTDALGNFTISNVPEGTYDFLRAEKDGFHYSVLSNIAVTSGNATTVDDQMLLLSTGASGWFIIDNGSGFVTSLTVTLTIAATDNAVLMLISEDPLFMNAVWEPIKSSTIYSFSGFGTNTLYIKFADFNGPESAPSSETVFIDTSPSNTFGVIATSGDSQATITWNPIIGALSYNIYFNTSPDVTTLNGTMIEAVTSPYIHSNLSNGTDYYYIVVAVKNGGEFLASTEVSAKPLFNASLLGYYNTNVQAWDVALSSDDTKAYIAGWGGYDGFQIIDVSNPAAPSLLGSIDTTYSSDHVKVSSDGTKAYLDNDVGGFRIIDISNPSSPSIIGTYNNGNPRTRGFAINNNETIAYVTDGIVGLQILDISNPASPTLISTYDPSVGCSINGEPVSEGNCEANNVSLSSDGTIAYLASGWGGLKILDISNADTPKLLSTLDTNADGASIAVGSVVISSDGTRAFLSLNTVVDISNPSAPSLITVSPLADSCSSVIKLSNDETIAYSACQNYGVQFIDISNPSSPLLIGKFYEVINNTAPQVSGLDISGDETKAFVAEGINGLRIIDISGLF